MSPLKCPVCDGQGHLNKPPWVAGDQATWVSVDIRTYECHACQGRGWLRELSPQDEEHTE